MKKPWILGLLTVIVVGTATTVYVVNDSVTKRTDTDRGQTARFYTGGDTPTTRAEVYQYGNQSNKSIVFVPGLGLDEYIYTETPDGRDGWAQIFRDEGYTSYAFNPPSIVDTNQSMPADAGQWTLSRVYTRWGFGQGQGEPYPDSQYPVENISALEANFPAYTMTRSGGGRGRGRGGGQGGGRFGSQDSTDALIDLLERTGPATVVVHSAQGPTGFAVARQRPGLVDHVAAVEPVGCPTQDDALFNVSFTAMYGDYIESRRQTGRKEACQTTVTALQEKGVDAKMIDLPARNITGNSHLMMQGRNNHRLASLLAQRVSAS